MIGVLQGHTSPVVCLEIFGLKGWLVSCEAGDRPTVIVWDLLTHEKLVSFRIKMESVRLVCFAPDSRQIAFVGVR